MCIRDRGQTFRAGTIGTLADKTAFGFVKRYYEERGIHKRNCEIDRIVQGCVGVRRTTGQHPGGIVVLPIGEEIYSFTPVQRPANDMTTSTVTTHFDYHSIDHNLLKLDILGHQDPTMIRMLQDLTGLDPVNDIPLDSPEVMSLFQNTSALGITPDDIGGCKLGALGIPEFGTDFAMQMLLDAKPKYFSDLVRIAGLAHGTDVWLGNAKDLILSGQATIQTAICCRDDIMVYLIQMGLEEGLSFTIMESVRKGKGLKPEWIEEMKAHNVPQWYIDSCLKIKYMFPKAHAAAYVMMAWRVAFCKVFYPLAYYAAFFSIRANGFSYELMCQGLSLIHIYLVWLIFLSSWGCDTSAYCVGMLFGKHKMAPVLSPKKSIEGAIGGIAGSALLGILFAGIFGAKFSSVANPQAACAIACAIAAAISQIGDLAASAIKRNHNIKDYGNLIPGHGGILDRFDSMLFTAPAIYFAVTFLVS